MWCVDKGTFECALIANIYLCTGVLQYFFFFENYLVGLRKEKNCYDQLIPSQIENYVRQSGDRWRFPHILG